MSQNNNQIFRNMLLNVDVFLSNVEFFVKGRGSFQRKSFLSSVKFLSYFEKQVKCRRLLSTAKVFFVKFGIFCPRFDQIRSKFYLNRL